MRDKRAVEWNWTEAGRGALSALPGALMTLVVDASAGMGFALGALVVAMLGVPPSRRDRPRLGLVGLAFALAYGLGSVLGLWPVAAVVALALLAYAGVLASARTARARLLPALLLPALALGMNHPAPDGFAVAAILLAGAAWATGVTYAWPQARPPALVATGEQTLDPASARRKARVYGILFAAASGIGLALGYLFDLTHVAWAAAAAMFIMRPEPGLVASRAAGRVLATFAGVIAAGLIVRRGPSELAVALLAVGAVSAMLAVRGSRWYVTPAGSALVVLLMAGVAGEDAFAVSFVERLLETALGAALALAFGTAAPALLRRRLGDLARER